MSVTYRISRIVIGDINIIEGCRTERLGHREATKHFTERRSLNSSCLTVILCCYDKIAFSLSSVEKSPMTFAGSRELT